MMNMAKKITIILLAVSCSCLVAFFVVCGNGSNCTLSSVYENDRNNDGVVDAVYRYTLDINNNMIKVEIDPHNDGHFQKGCCYNLGAESKCDLLKKSSGG